MPAGDLVQSQQIDPAVPVQGGVGSDSRLVLWLKSDMTSFTVDATDKITAVTLAAGKSAFVFEGIRQSLKPKFERVAAESGQSVFRHTYEFFIYGYDQLTKNNILRITQGRYCGAFENAKIDANTIEVAGIDVGLEVVECVRMPQDLGGAWKVVLASPDKENEAKPPRTLDGGTGIYLTNRAIIDALAFLPTITTLSVTTYPTVTPTALTITGTNFFAGGSNDGVLSMQFVNNATGAITNIPKGAAGGTFAVASNTSITFTNTSNQVPAGSYKIKITTLKGSTFSPQNIILT